jgi:hypothetical protein
MTLSYTVYCKQSAAALNPEYFLNGIRQADLYAIAEGPGVEEEAIDAALRALRVEASTTGNRSSFQVCFRPSGLRQVLVELWETNEEVETVISEVLSDLSCEQWESKAEMITSRLGQANETVDISFGNSPQEAMAVVIASEAARFLAEKFNGVVRDSDDQWWLLDADNRYKQV